MAKYWDILGRTPKEFDLILTMIVSRDSDGMRYGIWHKNMIYSTSRYHYTRSVVKSVPSNFYIIENPIDKELEVKEKELLGKSVTIKHANDIISVYQSLKDVDVKQGDKVTSGQNIGTSGK